MHNLTDPLVSVILPVYNRQHTIRRAVDSVLAQTFWNFELIIVDDASTDQTPAILQSYQDPRIRILVHKERLGAPASRNRGAAAARGRWIAFQDSDDEWMADKLEKQLKLAKEHERAKDTALVIYTGFHRYKDGKIDYIPAASDPRPKDGYINRSLLLGNFISTQTVLMPKSMFLEMGGFDEQLPRFQDWELWLRLSVRYPFRFIDEPLVNVYFTDDSISSDQTKLVEAYNRIDIKHSRLFHEAGPRYLASFLFSYGHNLCLYGDVKNGRKKLIAAWRSDPLSLRCIGSMFVSLFGASSYRKLYNLLFH